MTDLELREPAAFIAALRQRAGIRTAAPVRAEVWFRLDELLRAATTGPKLPRSNRSRAASHRT